MRLFRTLTLMLALGLVVQVNAQTKDATAVAEKTIAVENDKTDKDKVAPAVEEEEEEPKFTLSGSADTYFRTNLNAPNDITTSGLVAPATSFANLPGFSLGMVNLVGAYETEKGGVVADLVFGPRGSDAVFASPLYSNSAQIVNQLYAYWNVSDNATITMGNFNTFLGYEVISPTANFNYSTSYMFSYGPFSHSGLKADFALGDATVMLGVFNTTDATDFSPDGKYYTGAQLGYAGQYLNFLAGDGNFQVDYTGGLDLSDETFLGVNATWNKDLFSGAALYVQQAFSDEFSLGIRGEYFMDVADVVLAGDPTKDENVIDITVSANYAVGSLTFIPELRVDAFSEDIVTPKTGDAPQGMLASFVLGVVYAF